MRTIKALWHLLGAIWAALHDPDGGRPERTST